jgi:NUMOD3 motif
MDRADQRAFHYIYKITRTDGKYYIGLHSTDDLEDGYFGSGQRLWKSIKKHGKDKHSKIILEFLASRKELKDRERALVTKETLTDPLCLNLIHGGGSGPEQHTMKTREKISAATRGVPKSDAMRAKLSQSKKGIPRSEETKRRMGAAQTGRVRPHSPDHEAKRLAAIKAYWAAKRLHADIGAEMAASLT